jgi:FtsZ-binding cell division protein ZapB
MRMMDRLDKAQSANDQLRAETQITIDRLRAERDAWEDQYDEVFVERDDLLRRNRSLEDEIRSYDDQIRTMKATLTISHQNYDNTQDVKRDDYTLPSKDDAVQ